MLGRVELQAHLYSDNLIQFALYLLLDQYQVQNVVRLSLPHRIFDVF